MSDRRSTINNMEYKMSKLYKLLGIICSLFLLMCTYETNSRTNNPLPKESSAFQCLLNIPMGISLGELNEYLGKCPNLKMYDYEDNALNSRLDISSYNNQTLFNTTCALLQDGKDSLSEVYFYFFKGKLYEVSGVKQFDNNRSSFIASQISNVYGKPTKKKNLRNFMGNEFYLYSQYWRFGNTSITLDDDREVSHMLIIQNDSISNIASDFKSTSVRAIVYIYNGYDKKKKLSERQWHSENPEQTQQITTQCEGIGKITLKGSGNNITCKILCQDGKVVFEKHGINIKGNKEALVLKEFPSNCEEVFAYKREEGDVYTTYYTLVLEKNGIELFKGIIDTQDCVE